VLGVGVAILVAVYAVYQKINHPDYSSTFYYLFLLFAIITAILLGLGLRKLRDELKVNMSVLFITTVISVYGFETYLRFGPNMYETRTQMEVIEDLRDSGINAYPNALPYSIFIESNGLKTVKETIFNIGGISNITTVLRNESGYYPIVKTDEHGFNNPKGLYQKNKVDIVLIGDSLTEGYAVHSDETISTVIRKFGFNTLSFGKASSGTLLEFAGVKEYAEPLKPKVVLWMYFINDLKELKREMKLSLLLNYLNDNGYSQNLFSRQEEIDSLLLDYVEDKWESEPWTNHWTFKILKLYDLRLRINLRPTPTSTTTTTPTTPTKPTSIRNIFKDILQKSNQMVSGWGGKMYFVYLPEFSRYSTGKEHSMREFVLHTVNELEIPIIDIHSEVFVPHKDPLSLFPFRTSGHYNAEGYRLVGESISNRLRADGITPLNSRK